MTEDRVEREDRDRSAGMQAFVGGLIVLAFVMAAVYVILTVSGL